MQKKFGIAVVTALLPSPPASPMARGVREGDVGAPLSEPKRGGTRGRQFRGARLRRARSPRCDHTLQ